MGLFKRRNTTNILETIKRKNILVRIAQLLVGTFLVAVAFNLFFLKNEIVYGGISGLSIITKSVLGWNPSIFILICSIILLVVSYFMLGKEKTAGSVAGSLLLPLLIELTKNIGHYISIDSHDLLLICIIGGVITGFGYGLVFKAGFTTGGTDIINQILSKYFKISMGKALIFTDGFVVLGSNFVFGWTKVMYALIVLYIWSIMMDRVLLGISSSKCFHIITNKESEVKDFILTTLNTGVTVMDAKGGYTGDKEKVLMCVVDTKDYYVLKEGIISIDNNAFFIVTDSYEVNGGK